MSVLGTFTRVCFFEDEQVALKKKLKETLEREGVYFWAKPGNNKIQEEQVETADPAEVRLSLNTTEHTVLTALFQNSSTFNPYENRVFIQIQ